MEHHRYFGCWNWKVETKIPILSSPNKSNKHLMLFPSSFSGDSPADFLFHQDAGKYEYYYSKFLQFHLFVKIPSNL